MTTDLIDVPQPARAIQAQPTPADLLRIAVEGGADLDRLERLMALQEQWEKREAEKAYSAAFAAFKAEAVSIVKNKTVTDGPLKGKSYAELFAVVEAVTPLLSKHGLSSSWRLTRDDKDWIEVTCTLRHVLGHSDSVSMGGPPDTGGAKNAIQARASSVSYLERYTLKAICGLSERDDDDDGRRAGRAEGKADRPGSRGHGVIKPTDGAGDGLAQDMRDYLQEIALRMVEADRMGEPQKAADIYYDPTTFPDAESRSDEQVYLWSLLSRESRLRRYVKDHPPMDQDKAR